MSARTVAVRRALAQAGTKGLAHLATQQNTGTWISRCGRQVRGQDIRSWDGEAAGAQAEALGAGFCDQCRSEAIAVAGSVVDGVAILNRLDPAGDGSVQLLELPLDAIAVDPKRMRVVDESGDAIAGLVHSVREYGVLQPVVARRTPTGLQLVIGGRRLAAARHAGLETIPTLVGDMTDEQALVGGLVENLHREGLNPIEQARAYQRGVETLQVTKEALADRLGISRAQLSNTIRLLGLPEHLQDLVATGVLTAAHGRALLQLNDQPDEQDGLADQIITETLSTRAAQRAASHAVGGRRMPDPQLVEIARLLTGRFDTQVKITDTTADHTRIVIDVARTDLPRVLTHLGVAA